MKALGGNIMKIVNVSKLYDLCGPRGGAKSYFAIINEEGNFLSLDGETTYIPCGGRYTLKTSMSQLDGLKASWLTIKLSK